jgi:hypothetical protein
MRKNIDLPTQAIEVLDWLAEKDGRPTKNYIERVLIGHSNDYEEAYKKAKPKSLKPVKK